MPLDEFWHGDMRLLEAYRIAYERNVSYTAWMQGQYNHIAHAISLSNGFATKGATPKQFPNWKDPIAKKRKKKVITSQNIENEFRKEQAKLNSWLFNK